MIDIGANFAQMSIEFSKFPNLLNGSLESDVENPVVLSWEAEPFVYQVALLNIQTNNKQHLIRLFPNAVWNVDDLEVSFPEPDFLKMDSWGSYGLDPNLNLQGERMIKTVAIDSLKIEQQIAFMKIDIQGSDLNALLGSVETIKRHKMPIIFEFEEMFSSKFKYTFQDYVDFVRNVNYRFEKVIENNYLIVSND
jgi:FkbM family methyltransferase